VNQMEVNIIDLSGKSTKKINSGLFDEPLRPDLIKKAVLASQATASSRTARTCMQV